MTLRIGQAGLRVICRNPAHGSDCPASPFSQRAARRGTRGAVIVYQATAGRLQSLAYAAGIENCVWLVSGLAAILSSVSLDASRSVTSVTHINDSVHLNFSFMAA